MTFLHTIVMLLLMAIMNVRLNANREQLIFSKINAIDDQRKLIDSAMMEGQFWTNLKFYLSESDQ